jgi:poly(3-hydroxybutyrate) depolymerase
MGALFRCAALLAVLCGLVPAGGGSCRAQELRSYAIRPDRIFVAGISSGGFMAVQMHLAWSGTFRGAAIYAGGPDGCAEGSLATALGACSSDSPPIPLRTLESRVAGWAREGLIDPLQNLRGQPVYLWAGRLDGTVVPRVTDDLRRFYTHFGADVFRYDDGFAAEHGWESPDGPLPCAVKASPYIIACRLSDMAAAGAASASQVYDSEAVWLSRWFGPLTPRNAGRLRGTIISFAQDPFAPGGDAAAISMDRTGYAFVPEGCAAGRTCGLVLALHGCLQSHGAIGMTFVERAGINEWADTNGIVVLYPQAATYPPSFLDFGNPLGCWDWWGYLDDPDYAVKTGPQMRALHAIVARAAGLPSR